MTVSRKEAAVLLLGVAAFVAGPIFVMPLALVVYYFRRNGDLNCWRWPTIAALLLSIIGIIVYSVILVLIYPVLR